MERDQGIGIGFGCVWEEGWTGPDVSEGDAVQGVSRWPDGGEAIDEERPEGGDVDVSCRTVVVRGRLCLEEICVSSMGVHSKGGGVEQN